MCNRFHLKTNLATLGNYFDTSLRQRFVVEPDVFPGKPTPVIATNREGSRECLPMRFGLVPFGKRPADQKRALTNARVENLGKWPWGSCIRSFRCVVPMNGFREPCYWGDTAGTEVDFTVPGDRPMLAAAIYSWHAPEETGTDETATPLLTMSLIMRPALPIVMEHGHHRSPLFIDENGIDAWIWRDTRTLEDSLAVLKTHAVEPELTPTIARHMAVGWKKRQADHVQKRDDQLRAIEADGPLGF